MEDSHPSDELMWRYTAGDDLPEDVVKYIETHLDECPKCQEEYFRCLRELYPSTMLC